MAWNDGLMPGNEFAWRGYHFKRGEGDAAIWLAKVEHREVCLKRSEKGGDIIWSARAGMVFVTATQVGSPKAAGFGALDRLWDIIKP